MIAEYRAKAEAFAAQQAEWEKLKDSKTYTKDGHQVELAANIGTPKDLEGVVNNGAEGVGLYRTEFYTWILTKCQQKKINLKLTKLF